MRNHNIIKNTLKERKPKQNIMRQKQPSTNTFEFLLYWSATAGPGAFIYMLFIDPVRIDWRKFVFEFQAVFN